MSNQNKQNHGLKGNRQKSNIQHHYQNVKQQ